MAVTMEDGPSGKVGGKEDVLFKKDKVCVIVKDEVLYNVRKYEVLHRCSYFCQCMCANDRVLVGGVKINVLDAKLVKNLNVAKDHGYVMKC